MRMLFVAAFLLNCAAATVARPAEQEIRFGHFGTVRLFGSTPHPPHVALLISGGRGWDTATQNMADALENAGALVVGVDVRHYMNSVDRSEAKCAYPSGDFEPLSHFVEKKLGFPNYVRPVLVGYQEGAALAYAVLAQSPAGTFQGAISLGFRPTLPMTKPLCRGSGLQSSLAPGRRKLDLHPATDPQGPWIVLQGAVDGIFSPADAQAFVDKVKGAELDRLPGVTHRFPAAKDWAPQLQAAFNRIVERPPAVKVAEAPEVRDLPLVEIPAGPNASSTLAVLLSGDGGWAGLDRNLGSTLAANGISVVGLNSLQYFWHERTPGAAAHDLERILEHYLSAWKKQDAIIVGYSFGADVLPFMADRLPSELKQRIRLLALLGPSTSADFEFHLTDWVGDFDRKTSLPVLPEVEKLRGLNLLCVCGEDEDDSPCLSREMGAARVVRLDGGHHFNGDYQALSRSIIAAAAK